jgi:hypothetical protein
MKNLLGLRSFSVVGLAILIAVTLGTSLIKSSEIAITPEHYHDAIELATIITGKEHTLKLLSVPELAKQLHMSNEQAGEFGYEIVKKSQCKLGKLYSDLYTHEEVIGLLQFFKSDIGKKHLANTPHITQGISTIIPEVAKEVILAYVRKK